MIYLFKYKDSFILSHQNASDIALIGKSNIKRTNKLSLYSCVAGPVYIKDLNHWTLLYVDIITSTVFYFDPLINSNSNQSAFDTVFNNWLQFAQEFSDLKNIQWQKPSMHTQTQQDNFSCGVFVCYFFSLLKKKDLNFLVNLNLSSFRAHIDETIFKYLKNN